MPLRHVGLDARTEQVATAIVDRAIAVHRELGPGLLESVDRRCLAWELREHGLQVAEEGPIAFRYKECKVNMGFRADLIVEDLVLVELKAVETLHNVHFAQVSTYLRLSGLPLGFLINFEAVPLKTGLHRIIRAQKGQ